MTNAKDQNLYVNMFGSFSMQYGLNTINDLDVRSRKSWIILGYLIAYRNRAISQSEIIDIIYPEGKSDNPANALKTMIHRVRSLLDALNFVSGKVMILQSGGSYMWNKDLPLVLDVDSFENLCQLATSSDLSDDQRLQYYLDAIEIYKGDFLSKLTMESWVTQLNTYYHTMYIHAVHQAITLFIAKEDYPHIVELCSRALTIDAYDEFFHYNLILSLTKMQNS
ncbi:MAG: bacterial transcriptional activator domain-containing protein, partial [Clostridiales bacterium]